MNNQLQINHLPINHFTSELRKINLFMQNKPNLLKSQMNANKVLTRNYENVHLADTPKTNPKQTQSNPIQTQNKPNFKLFAGDVVLENVS
jgi:hypothetical protein